MEILVTGSTGYIGGRLVPRLLEAGHSVRVLSRDAAKIKGRLWSDQVTVFEGDLLDPPTLVAPLEGVDVAYYLVHSMTTKGDFEEQDRKAANAFAEAARDVPHTIYLGGLMPPEGEAPSKHLRSRAEVGRILRDRLLTTEFRAGPIIGSGSTSFELVRHLTERLPVMITPKWVRNLVQPIGVRDILTYLIAAVDVGPAGVIDVGADPITFKEMMKGYAAERGLTRRIIPVPVLTPRLASYWAAAVTPVSGHIASALIEGVINSLIANRDRAEELFGDIEPMPYRTAVSLALQRVEEGEVETRWSGSNRGSEEYEFEEVEGLYRASHSVCVDATQEDVFRTFTSVGGENGWFVWNGLWRVRGMMDKMIGGPGLRRGRRHPNDLFPGEAVDFWRVEEVTSPSLLRLRAEMKVPGRAWLQWETRERAGGESCDLMQTAIYAPKGLWGRLYWWGSYVFHLFIFGDMINEVKRRAEESAVRKSKFKSQNSKGGDT